MSKGCNSEKHTSSKICLVCIRCSTRRITCRSRLFLAVIAAVCEVLLDLPTAVTSSLFRFSSRVFNIAHEMLVLESTVLPYSWIGAFMHLRSMGANPEFGRSPSRGANVHSRFSAIPGVKKAYYSSLDPINTFLKPVHFKI